jgi:SagB-type dehydrogenase family enzyme
MIARLTIATLAGLLLLACGDGDKDCTCDDEGSDAGVDAGQEIDAPGVLWDIIAARRSTFGWGGDAVTAENAALIARAAQGVTLPDVPTGRATATGLRAAPSPGALYPIELYVVADNVEGMEPGLYHYDGEADTLTLTDVTGTIAEQVGQLASDQDMVKQAALILIITGVEDRVTGKYGDRGIMYMHMEMGHAAQNALLMGTALGLATRPFGAMNSEAMNDYLQLPDDHWPAYVLGFGTPAE